MNALRTSVAAATALMLSASGLAAQALGTGIPTKAGETGSRVGLSGATFLEIPIGARETALGGAAAASTSGLTALYWNTAAAADLRGPSAAVSFNDLYGGSGLKQTYAAAAIPVQALGVVGFSFNYFTSGEIVATTEQFPEGGDPTAGGTVSWDGYAAGLHLARRLTDRLAIGIAGKYISDGITYARASWVAMDASTEFRTGLFGTTLGASLSNLGTTSHYDGPAIQSVITRDRDVYPVTRDMDVKYKMKDVPLPSMVQFAISTQIIGGPEALFPALGNTNGLTLDAAMATGNDRAIQPLAGIEYRFRDVFFARIGKRFYMPSDGPWSYSYGLAGGVGLKFPVLGRHFTFDYATSYQGSTDLPATNTFTLQYGY